MYVPVCSEKMLRDVGMVVPKSNKITGPAETVGQVGHLPYHFLVVNTGNDVL